MMLNGRSETKRLLNALDNVTKPQTIADRIQSMTLEELHALLVTVAFEESPWDKLFLRECCAKCQPTTGTLVETGQEVKLYECDFTDGKCPHGDAIMWWLQQPAEEAPT